ncbi:Soluble pyridine nucleotide transhydrogenase [Polystyrenella longa]|uniref:Soluble pyridine nucleotide transhydrogenase n=1 Tax=Polystyrenella longa TaxID=2528007 RepID=A0A518CMC6_9PLAN|nr:Si-specific NAD(P)(+) transhydrogenase [Polystyrenella longa]QDU80334.1 Soluble pyridine nucleotide transhydrogenase [Polystyrenella longa]
MKHYDLIVIGSGPAGHKGAIAASKMGKKVALIERQLNRLGGVCLHTGTIPSKTMREAIMHLTGYRQREVYSELYRRKRHIKMDDLRKKIAQVTQHERDLIHDQLERNGIDVHCGDAQFLDEHTVGILTKKGDVDHSITGDKILIACGTKPARPDHMDFDGKSIFDTDQILDLEDIPRSMIVVGGGVIGIEYAIMFAILGVEVTVVDGRERLLDFCDREVIETLLYHARSLEMVMRLGEDVTSMDRQRNGSVVVQLESGKRLIADTALFSAGRVGDVDELDLPAAGLKTDERGRLWCDENFRTWQPHIYGVGDIVGFPALASTSMEQGRRAVCNMFNKKYDHVDQLPYGLYTIPEISMIGKTEHQLTQDKVPYEVGVARYHEIARGHISGDVHGMLKILFHRETKKLLGVHCIGESATELTHIGQAVMAFDGTIEYFRDTVFNYPTMSESYKVAAFDGLNKLQLDLELSESSYKTAEAEQKNLTGDAKLSEDSEVSQEEEAPVSEQQQVVATMEAEK